MADVMVAEVQPPTPSPPRARHSTRRGPTRFEKESAATGGKAAADLPGDPKVIGPWRIGRTIGKGASGKSPILVLSRQSSPSGRVKIAKHSKTGQYAAIKIVPKHALLFSSRMSITEAGAKHDKAVLGIEREIVIMKLIDHPNVMSLYDVWETAKELYLVLEYVEGGELFDYLVSQGRLPPDEASRYFQQIIAGVDYCHRFNICHRDLKPENLLLDAEKNIKIADFGMAALEPSDRLLETSCGSPHYASPEIVAGMSYHGAASDIWSCGVILFALLTGRLPFDDENIRVLLQKVKNGRFSIPADLPADAKDLITRMLVVDPERRITMADIMRHPFFQRKQDTDSGRKINLVEPPRLEEIARPVRSEREIDRDILRNLRTLWNGIPEKEIVQSLLTHEKTWEKAFYFLLLQYRNKHLENFNPEPEQHRIPSERRRREASHKRSSRTTVEAKKPIARDHREVERATTERRHARDHHASPQASRPAPKSPANAPPRVHGPRPAITAPSSPATGEIEASRPVTPVHLQPAAIEQAPTTTPIDPRLPKIMLQRPTPEGSDKAPTGLGFTIPAPPPSPSPSPLGQASYTPAITGERTTIPGIPGGSTVTSSPPLGHLGNINVPQVEDAALQKFFHDIAEQLHLIGSASPRSSIAMDSPMASPALSHGGSTAPGTPIPTPEPLDGPVLQNMANAPVKPRPAQPARTQSETPAGTVKVNLVDQRRRSYLGDATSRENTMAQNASNNAAMQRQSIQLPKDRKSVGAAVKHTDSKRKSKPAPLDLSPQIVQADQLLSPTSSPHMPASPLLVGPSSEMKQSWFSNLFSWKPAMFTLISADDCASSRAECIKLLESFGASVILEDADGWGVLKCRVEEIRDVSGIIITKSVKFRIEFLPHANWTPGSPHPGNGNSPMSRRQGSAISSRGPASPNPSIRSANGMGPGGGNVSTSMTMVQEKGALSAFRAVYGRIRAEWRLDSLKSPALTSNSRFSNNSPLASPALSDNPQGVWS